MYELTSKVLLNIMMEMRIIFKFFLHQKALVVLSVLSFLNFLKETISERQLLHSSAVLVRCKCQSVHLSVS